jgi:hypothetical protein
MTDAEKLTTATDALRECEVLSRSPMPFQAIVRLVEIHDLVVRKLAELGIATAPGTPIPEPTAPIIDDIFEAARIEVDPKHAGQPTVEFWAKDSYRVDWLQIMGSPMNSPLGLIELHKRYRITITEEPCPS